MTVVGGVVVAVVLAWLWSHTLARGSKGSAPGRLLAVLAFAIVVWLFTAVNNPAAGAKAASFAAGGTATLFAGLGHFISAL